MPFQPAITTCLFCRSFSVLPTDVIHAKSTLLALHPSASESGHTRNIVRFVSVDRRQTFRAEYKILGCSTDQTYYPSSTMERGYRSPPAWDKLSTGAQTGSATGQARRAGHRHHCDHGPPSPEHATFYMPKSQVGSTFGSGGTYMHSNHGGSGY